MIAIRQFAILLTVGGFLATAAPASAEMGRGFDVVNRNVSASVQRVWTALNGRQDLPWVAANLNSAVAPRATTRLTLGEGANCFYDVKVQFSDGYALTFVNINVCRFDSVLAD